MEADSDNTQSQLPRPREQRPSRFQRRTELVTQTDYGAAVVDEDPHEELRVGQEGLDGVELVQVVKGRLEDAHLAREDEGRCGLAWVRKDDPGRVHAETQDGAHLLDGGAVEAGAQLREELQ